MCLADEVPGGVAGTGTRKWHASGSRDGHSASHETFGADYPPVPGTPRGALGRARALALGLAPDLAPTGAVRSAVPVGSLLTCSPRSLRGGVPRVVGSGAPSAAAVVGEASVPSGRARSPLRAVRDWRDTGAFGEHWARADRALPSAPPGGGGASLCPAPSRGGSASSWRGPPTIHRAPIDGRSLEW